MEMDNIVQYGALRLNVEDRLIHHAGATYRLTRQQTHILKILALHGGASVSRSYLQQALWQDTIEFRSNNQTINAQVGKIRRPLRLLGMDIRYGRFSGYQLMIRPSERALPPATGQIPPPTIRLLENRQIVITPLGRQRLTRQQFSILQAFVLVGVGNIVDVATLVHHLWGDQAGPAGDGLRVIRTQISNLRKAVYDLGIRIDHLHRNGYWMDVCFASVKSGAPPNRPI